LPPILAAPPYNCPPPISRGSRRPTCTSRLGDEDPVMGVVA
jgi:hypothetical protein